MKADDILDAIGEVDDEYIRNAKQDKLAHKKTMRTRHPFIGYSRIIGLVAAACFIFVILAYIAPCYLERHDGTHESVPESNNSANENASRPQITQKPEPNFQDSENDSDESMDGSDSVSDYLEETQADIYYVQDNTIVCDTECVMMSVPNVFEAWKQKQGIGEDVKLVEFIETMQTPEQAKRIKIVISQNIAVYYEAFPEEQLLEGLRKTISSFLDIKSENCSIVLT